MPPLKNTPPWFVFTKYNNHARLETEKKITQNEAYICNTLRTNICCFRYFITPLFCLHVKPPPKN